MAEVVQVFRPEGAVFSPDFVGPQLSTFTSGSSGHPVTALRFDATAVETVFFAFRAVGLAAAGSDVSVDLTWFADGSPTGNVVWGASLLAITPEVDANVCFSETFGTEQTVLDVNLSSPAYRLHRVTVSIPLAATDLMAANDYVVLKIRRVATDSGDTLGVDAGLVEVAVRYTQA